MCKKKKNENVVYLKVFLNKDIAKLRKYLECSVTNLMSNAKGVT